MVSGNLIGLCLICELVRVCCKCSVGRNAMCHINCIGRDLKDPGELRVQ